MARKLRIKWAAATGRGRATIESGKHVPQIQRRVEDSLTVRPSTRGRGSAEEAVGEACQEWIDAGRGEHVQ